MTAAKTSWEHGTSYGYQYAKCRCDTCKGWKRDYQRKLRKSPLALVGDPTVDLSAMNRALIVLAQRHRSELQQIVASMQGGGV